MQRTFTIATTAALVAALLLGQASRTLEVQFKAAQQKEEVEGDLKGAIEQYKKIAEGGERVMAAKALIRMAECHQKLGDAEAHKIYERVVRDYADQREAVAVAVARARLGGADRAVRQGGIALRKVWAGDISGTVSPDGRRLSYVDWVSPSIADWGTLLLHDFASGADRPLTRRDADGEGVTLNTAFAKDGTQIAYTWCKAGHCELRIASLQGKGMPLPRRLFERSEDVVQLGPIDWSPDGKWIAVVVHRQDRTAQIGLVAVQGGSLRVLKSVDWRGPTRIFFSLDGQDLAFDLPASETGDRRDVFVLAVDGSREVAAVVHPSNDIVMGWSPDGKHLLFASDRNGAMGLWGLAFAKGKPQGTPELLQANIGSTWSMGVTSAGSLYLGVYSQARSGDIEVASIDLDTGKQIVPPARPIQSFTGSNRDPCWSPDGKYLAYVSFRSARPDFDSIIGIRSVETGQVRELQLRPRLSWFVGLSWAPDGRSFAVFGTDLKGRNGVFGIDAHTGEVSPIAVPIAEKLSYDLLHWSLDGKRMYYVSQIGGEQTGTIYERDLASGNVRELIRGDVGPISLSPDGRWIATSRWDGTTKSQAVVVIPVEGGEPRELLRVTEPQWINNTSMPWTPDGRGLLVRKMLVAGGKLSELWLVPVADAPPRKLDFDANRVATYAPGKIRLHPDGRQLAYYARSESTTGTEVWVLENFLPSLRAAR